MHREGGVFNEFYMFITEKIHLSILYIISVNSLHNSASFSKTKSVNWEGKDIQAVNPLFLIQNYGINIKQNLYYKYFIIVSLFDLKTFFLLWIDWKPY